jgi:hypothetical protein
MDVLEFVFKLKIWRVMIEEGNEYLGGHSKQIENFVELLLLLENVELWGQFSCILFWVVTFRYIIMLCV